MPKIIKLSIWLLVFATMLNFITWLIVFIQSKGFNGYYDFPIYSFEIGKILLNLFTIILLIKQKRITFLLYAFIFFSGLFALGKILDEGISLEQVLITLECFIYILIFNILKSDVTQDYFAKKRKEKF
ncbi:MAG: hypothetical protein KGV51_07140 [Moraxellaceae bacterium]|nr:hypothetical protein [Moraxellaceae bacterium]